MTKTMELLNEEIENVSLDYFTFKRRSEIKNELNKCEILLQDAKSDLEQIVFKKENHKPYSDQQLLEKRILVQIQEDIKKPLEEDLIILEKVISEFVNKVKNDVVNSLTSELQDPNLDLAAFCLLFEEEIKDVNRRDIISKVIDDALKQLPDQLFFDFCREAVKHINLNYLVISSDYIFDRLNELKTVF